MMNDKEYIKIPRWFFSSSLWNIKRTFTKCEACLDLIQSAKTTDDNTAQAYNSERIEGRGKRISVWRGQYPTSVRHLAEKWGWSIKAVRSFLDLLKNTGLISVENSQGMSVITIEDFDDYVGQNRGTLNALKNNSQRAARAHFESSGHTKGHTKGQARGTLNAQENSELQTTGAHKRASSGHTKGQTPIDNIYNNNISLVPKDSSINILGTANAVLPRGKGELSPAPSAPDYSEIVEFFNSATSGSFGTVRLPLSAARRGMIAARIRERGEDTFREAIRKAAASDFLRGQNRSGWRATFDWIIRPTNFEKIITGNYDNKRGENAATHGAAGSTGGSAINDDFLRGVAAGIARGSCQKGGGRDGEH